MKLTLNHRRIQVFVNEDTKELLIGQEIEYYGWGNSWINSPRIGHIDFDVVDGWFITWDDASLNTYLDDSEHSKHILKNCGFAKN